MARREQVNIQYKSLAYVDGASIIMEDENGRERYVYEDGSLDRGSTVDPRTPHVLIGGIVTNVTLRELPHEPGGPPDDAGAAAGSLAVREALDASAQPDLHIAA